MDAHDINKEVKIYLFVFGTLLFFTIVTVLVSYLHLNILTAVILALFIATIKASLVACYFMHLISERKLIYFILIMVLFFFAVLMSIPASESDKIHGSIHVA